MDLRLAHWIGVTWIALSPLAAGAQSDSVVVVEDDALPAGELDRWLEEWDGDVVALAAAEDLALDPVQLGTEDVERLRALPWIDAASLAALRAAGDAASITSVSRLPGWSRDTARRLAPFVVFAPGRAPAAALHVQRRRGAWRARAVGGAVSTAIRIEDETLRRVASGGSAGGASSAAEVAGWARFTQGPAEFWAGDLRLGHAQGLGLATAARGTVLPIARSAGLTGSASAGRTRVVRGAGAALDTRALQCTAVHGRLRDGTRCTAVATTLAPGGAWRLHASALRAGAARAASAGFTRARGPVALAAELTSAPAACAAAASWRGPTSQLALRALVSPGDLASPLTAAPRAAARDAAVAWILAGESFDLACEAAHTSRRDVTETARSTFSARAAHRHGRHRIVMHLAIQRSHRSGIDLESPFVESARTTATAAIAIERRLDRTWWSGLDLRAGARHADSLATAHTWQAWIERRAGAWRPFLAIASHTGSGPALGSPRSGALAQPALRGDRIRSTLQLRARTGPVTWRSGARIDWASDAAPRTVAEVALALDLRR